MALGHGPTVVTNGLVLALDAADINSFDKNENLLTYTSNIGGPNGYLSTTTATPNTSETLDPNETSTATKLDNAGNVNTYTYSQSTTLSTNKTYTYSIHIKQGTKPDFSVTIDENSFGGKRYQTTFTYSTETITTSVGGGANDGVLVGSSATKLANGWYRLSITFTTSTTNVSTFVDMMNRFGNTPGTNYVWGRQLEIGSSASTYYATTATAKTRGSTIIDLSGNGNTGTLTNGPTFNSSNGGSIAFDGTNDYVNIGIGRGVNQFSADFAVSAWVMRLSGGPTYGNIIGDYYTGSVATTNEWQLMMSGTAEFNFYRVGSNYVIPNTASGYSTSQWINVVVSRIGSTVSMYANNNLIATATNSTVFGTATGNLNIGIDGNNSSEPLSGRISNIMIYKNKGLTAAEISQNFNALRGRFGV